jgi:hypothetical protein
VYTALKIGQLKKRHKKNNRCRDEIYEKTAECTWIDYKTNTLIARNKI